MLEWGRGGGGRKREGLPVDVAWALQISSCPRALGEIPGANPDGADLGSPGTWVTWIQPTAQHLSPPATLS